MTKRIFELEIDLKSAKANEELKKFNRTIDDTNKKTGNSKTQTDKSSKGFSGLAARLGPVAAGLGAVTAAVGAAVGAFVTLDNVARTAGLRVQELENLSRVAGLSIQEFQGLSFAAERFGFTQDKVADVIQDFNDKLGDFTSTGAGPFVDVLKILGEESGVTVEELTKLSGRQGIERIIGAFESANVPIKEQVFLLESLASDLSRVTPLFANNGEAIDEATAALRENNALLTDLQVSRLTDYKEQVDLLDKQYEALSNTVASKTVPALEAINNAIGSFLGFVNEPSELELKIEGKEPTEQLRILNEELVRFEANQARIQAEQAQFGSLANFGTGGPRIEQRLASVQSEIDLTKELIGIIKEKETASAQAETARQTELENASKASQARKQELISEAEASRLAIQSQIDSLKNGTVTVDELNSAIAETAKLDALLKPLKERFDPVQLAEIKTSYEQLVVAQRQLTQAQKESEATQAELARVEAERKALADSNRATFASEVTGMAQELALLKEQDLVKRELLKTELQIRNLGLDGAQTNTLLTLQQQINAQRKLNDEKEKGLQTQKAFEQEQKVLAERLALSKLNNDADRERLQLEFELANSGYTAQQQNSIRILNEQIIAQERRNELLEQEKAAVQTLGEAIGSWAGGSKDAIKTVIAELIRLVAITQFGGTGNLLGGFLSGFGGTGSIRGFAKGGNFNAGETFVVGEAGPEIITSNAAGAVIPNNKAFGQTGTSLVIQPTLTVNGSVMDSDQLTMMFSEFSNSIAEQTQSMIKNELRPNGVFN